MIIPTKKLISGFQLPVYGLGLWQMGGRETKDPSKDELEVSAIQYSIEKGVTHIDTAESYGAGHAEELLGLAIKGYDRKKLIIASKVSGHNQSYDNLMRSFDKSLKRVGTDYLDLYLLHRFPGPGIDPQDTMRALDKLVEQKAVRHIGVCNLTVERFGLLQSLTNNKLVCNQLHHNVQYREVEHKGLLNYCQHNDVALVAWRPLQKGFLPNNELMKSMAAKYNKTPAQIAINWLISQPNVVTIAKTSRKEHLEENLGALGWHLDQADVELIRHDYPGQHKVSDAVPLDYDL